MMTWIHVLSLEPALGELLDQARNHQGPECPIRRWYASGGLRAALSNLVGWKRLVGPSELQGSDAYTVAYETIYGALPDCQEDCQCMNL